MAGTPGNIAQDFSDLAGHIGDILASATVKRTVQQTTELNDYSIKLTSYSNQLADVGAWNALHAAQGDFDKIKQATTDANAAAAKLKQQANTINKILQIVGDAVALGAAIAAGPLTGVLSAATTLASDSGIV
jgi:hypothetical protein